MSRSRVGVRTVDAPERYDADALAALVAAKGDATVSMCIPCRDEAATIGPLVSAVQDSLVERIGLVDELVVLDDRSTDDTARVAAHAGATVVSIEEIHAEHGTGHGKGNALWATLLASSGDLVVWCDGDVTSFEPDWVAKLIQPMLLDGFERGAASGSPSAGGHSSGGHSSGGHSSGGRPVSEPPVAMVKALYHRPTKYGGGGRTTELVARPLMSRFFPELTGLAQPLSGEYAARRCVLEELEFIQGWGVEMALLIDVAERHGSSAIAQVDLGQRLHRHQNLHTLSVQAAEVMSTVLDRAGVTAGHSDDPSLHRADGSEVPLNLDVRPAVAALRDREHARNDQGRSGQVRRAS